MKNKKIVIFGLGDIARLAHYYFENDSEYEVAGFTVDQNYMPSESKFEGKTVVSFSEVTHFFPPDSYWLFIALSYSKMNKIREKKYFEGKEKGYRLASYISSRATNLTQNSIGDNAFILEDNTIQPFVTIGSNVTLWSGNHIGHDSYVGDHTFISSHVVVSGHCKVGKNCFIGVNATLRNSIIIGDECLLGAGVAIMKNTEKGEVYLPPKSFLYDKKSNEVEL